MYSLTSWQRPFEHWRDIQRLNPTPLPTEINLDTIEGIEKWLMHPSNWKDTDLYVIGWNGLVPWISANHAWRLAPDCHDRKSLILVVLIERRRRKFRSQDNQIIEE